MDAFPQVADPLAAVRPEVEAVMRIEDVTQGGRDKGYDVRFRGQLLGDTEADFERLQPVFARAGMTLLFRNQDGRHVVLGVPGVIQPGPSRVWINVVVFIATVLSVLFTGATFANVNFYNLGTATPNVTSVAGILQMAAGGIPFTVALLAILLSHEFGHYLAARHHKTSVTLPYFIPFPTLLGTLGAFIQMKEPPKNRKILLDIGLAGPLAGFVVAVPILVAGIFLSHVSPLPASPGGTAGMLMEGNSLLYLAAKFVVKGQILPAPGTYAGVSPILYWLKYFFLGQPFPFGGRDIMIHPLAWAGWAGLLVTALNLMPAGQLDGGHLVYGLFGKRMSRLWMVIVLILIGFGFVWAGWWIWAALIFFLGRRYAEPLDEITTLDPGRRALAVLGLVIFVLTISPVPLAMF